MNTHKFLTYALNSDNRLMYINDVPNGLECNCICPGCKEKLIAKNDGKVREHHFAHASNKECITGYQTMIHLLAKDIIENFKIFPMALNGKYLSACEVYKEVNLNQFGFIPDIFGFTPITDGPNIIGKIPVIIEIFVTHKVDEEKKNKIIKAGIPAMEIDLSTVKFSTINELAKEIYNSKNWNLINGKIGQQYLPQIQIPVQQLVNMYRATFGSYSNTPRYTKSGSSKYYRRRK